VFGLKLVFILAEIYGEIFGYYVLYGETKLSLMTLKYASVGVKSNCIAFPSMFHLIACTNTGS